MATDMAEENSTIKKIYSLPKDLVGRISEYQEDKSLPSEVEAVRILLDLALKESDTLESLVYRAAIHLEAFRNPSNTARDILAGHPKVTSITFEPYAVRFVFSDRNKSEEVRINSKENIELFSDPKNTYEVTKSFGLRGYEIRSITDDEIPF